MSQSNKMIGKLDSMGGLEEPSRDFKKNRNMSTTSTGTNPPLSITLPTSNYSSQNINSPTLQNMPPHPSQGNPNMLYPTNNKLNGQNYPEAPKSPTFMRIGEDHRLIIEGVKLAIEIIESKLPNHMGYAHLLLTRTLSILN